MTTAPADDSERGRRLSRVWTAILFAAVIALGAARWAGDGPYGLDASYYTQLARHVAQGDGYVTTVSLYHHGEKLPAREDMSPVWPLLLGNTGRAIGVIAAANVLPKVFYLLDIVLLFFLARTICRRMGCERIAGLPLAPPLPHLIAALFAVSPNFYGATTHPYREGVAFALAFASLLMLDRYASSHARVFVAMSGLLAGLAFASRVQMVAVVAGGFAALAIVAVRDARHRLAPLLFGGAALLPVIPWVLHAGYLPDFGFLGSFRPLPESVALPSFYWPLPPRGVAERIADAAVGMKVAFDFFDPHSYARVFSIAIAIVPLAFVIWVIAKLRRRSIGSPSPERVVILATLITGLLSFALLLVYRGGFLPWYFGWRHGLTFIFLLLVAVPYAAMATMNVRIATIGTLIVAIALCAAHTIAFIRSPVVSWTDGERQLLQWLNARERPPVVLATRAQTLGMATDARLHMTRCGAPSEVTRAYLDRVGVEYVVVYENEIRCPFIVMPRPLRLIATFGKPGGRIFVLAPRR
jgi:hypothetical protein